MTYLTNVKKPGRINFSILVNRTCIRMLILEFKTIIILIGPIQLILWNVKELDWWNRCHYGLFFCLRTLLIFVINPSMQTKYLMSLWTIRLFLIGGEENIKVIKSIVTRHFSGNQKKCLMSKILKMPFYTRWL